MHSIFERVLQRKIVPGTPSPNPSSPESAATGNTSRYLGDPASEGMESLTPEVSHT
jgi:hypothetical protein